MSQKHTPDYWRDAARKITAHAHNHPRVHVSDVGKALSITGRQSIMNAINKMIELNVMYFEQDGEHKEYYLND